ETIRDRFTVRADLIKVSAALADLTRVAGELRPVAAALADQVDAEVALLHRRPELHQLREAQVLDGLRRAEAGLPGGFGGAGARRAERVRRLLERDPPAATATELLAAVAAGRAAWKRVSGDRAGALPLRRAADVVLESYARLAAAIKAG